MAATGGSDSPQGGGANYVPGGSFNGGSNQMQTAGSTSSLAGGNSVAGGSSAGAGNPGSGGAEAVGGSNSVAAGGKPGSGGSNPGSGTSSTCSLTVTVTTTAPGGQYQPRNVGAIWITDSSGRFLKSLEVWGSKRIARVVAWNAATKSAGVPGNEVDAVTSATLSAHRTHNVAWNCRDYKEQAVPDGNYRVYFEVADSNNGGPNIFETFSKGSASATVKASMGTFQNIVLTFTP